MTRIILERYGHLSLTLIFFSRRGGQSFLKANQVDATIGGAAIHRRTPRYCERTKIGTED
jgi:hypothetical protein